MHNIGFLFFVVLSQFIRFNAVLTDTYCGKFPSDHFPVATELSIQ